MNWNEDTLIKVIEESLHIFDEATSVYTPPLGFRG